MGNKNVFLDIIEEEQENPLEKTSDLEKSNDIFLITSILKPIETETIIQKMIKELENMVENDLSKLIGSLKNQMEIHSKTKDLVQKIDEFSKTPSTFNKKVVGIGGSFSAGKSRFINSIIDYELLPTDTTPTTSFPTFITGGDENKVYIHNSFSNKIELEISNLKRLSHELSEKYDTSFSHVIKKIIIENKNMKYNNLVILDTPGYTKPEITKKGYLTDEIMALEQLRIADYIIWLIDIEKGTISGTDIEFLKKINFKNKFFFVINKSDLKDKSAQLNVYESVIENLKKSEIEYQGVSVYSSKEKTNYSGDNLLEYFEEVNKKNNEDLINEIKNSIDEINKIFKRDITEKKNEVSMHLGIYNEILLFKEELENIGGIIENKIIDSKQNLKKEWGYIEKIEEAMLKFQVEFQKRIEKIFEELLKEKVEIRIENNSKSESICIIDKENPSKKYEGNRLLEKSMPQIKQNNDNLNIERKEEKIIGQNNKIEAKVNNLVENNNYLYLKENLDNIFNNILKARD